ncbi:uncharacterized protein KY384_005188 [Bacidia gigantensis]|uniref:uncharacterized protein n=1 Tax=Bacidia gigantensis TaxID=2732470 RepID=UPI001D038EFE|nr:uncharacterized protein KY384_005188 [Bacidia gigantensis]KAG8529707.1 hypothetical protein KY384_005188 [Bacidia gigantensis]
MARKFDRMPDLPQTVDDPKVEGLMEHYYSLSNAPNDEEDGHDSFTDMFTEDAEYSFNDKVSKGHAEISAMRKAMFAHVPQRDHYPTQIFTHGHDQMQLMARGKAKHEHHSGNEKDVEFAAYYQLVDVEGQLKFKTIHIIANGPAHE